MNKILTDYQTAHNEFNRHVGKLEDEVQRIVDILIKKFKVSQMIWWDWKYSEDTAAPPMISPTDEVFNIYIDMTPYRQLDDGVWCYNEGFPVEFFDMTEAEIFAHIDRNLEDTRKKKEEKKK